MIALVLCNTVQVHSVDQKDKNSNNLEYLADSPDEKALVEAAYKYGIILNASSNKIAEIVINNTKHVYKKLHIFEFDSVRKRMSVIVRDDAGKRERERGRDFSFIYMMYFLHTGRIFIYTKGAESELASLLNHGKRQETYQHIDDYARQGLRTLVIAMREIPKSEYDDVVLKTIHTATTTLLNRKEVVSAIDFFALSLSHRGVVT